jgi:hypothetical protein
MPENPAVARASAAENAQRNFPSLSTATPSTSGNTLTLSDAFGNSVTITAPFGADNNKMQVSVTETDQATFGRVIGASRRRRRCAVWRNAWWLGWSTPRQQPVREQLGKLWTPVHSS